MSGNTGISWTDKTWNPTVGCTKVSKGCQFCYAKTIHDLRHKALLDGKKIAPQYAEPFETVQLMPQRLDWPLSLRKPSRIFVNSVSDLFHEDVPDRFIDQVFLIMAATQWHTYQVLTKRPERMRDYSVARQLGLPLPNVWLGVSVENQAAANERIPLLLETPATIRFLSCEPLLGSVDLHAVPYMRGSALTVGNEGPAEHAGSSRNMLHWVIAGGESGTKKQDIRPMHPDWPRSLRDQCVAAGIPYHFKQWGAFSPTGPLRAPQVCVDRAGRVTQTLAVEGFPNDATSADGWQVMYRVGAKRAGRELDGRVWDEFPAVAV